MGGLKITEVSSFVVESDDTVVRIDYNPEEVTKAKIHIKNKTSKHETFSFLDVREAVNRFADKFVMEFADCWPPSDVPDSKSESDDECPGKEVPAPGYISAPPSDEEYIPQQEDEEVEEQDSSF